MEDNEKQKFKNKIYKIKSKYKTGIYVNKTHNEIATEIKEWYDSLLKRNVKSLGEVKDYFASLKDKKNERISKIINTILSCKDLGERIAFNNNLFLKRLRHYVYVGDIPSRCLTNDILNLCVTYNTVLNDDEFNLQLASMGSLALTQITSENFIEDTNAFKGYVQDYDGTFSCIFSNKDSLNIDDIVAKKNRLNNFFYEGRQYNYFGDETYCVVYLEGMSDKEIIEKIEKAQFIQNKNNSLTTGERRIEYNNKLFYINKDVTSEDFCPSFIMFNKTVNMNYLFEFDLDYNELFTFIEDRLVEGKNAYPLNLCYWDTINYCFEFLLIFHITSNKIKPEQKKIINEWCSEYFKLRTYISQWKDNQLLLHRVVYDFLYAFLNNSDFNRFLNISKRIKKYIAVYTELKKHVSYNQVLSFFSTIPFACFIKNQLVDKVFSLAEKINEVINNYINGRVANLVDTVREVARTIQGLLPRGDMKEAAFPFIVANGSLTGTDIKINDPNSDPIFINITKNGIRLSKLRKLEKNVLKDASDNFVEVNEAINDFIKEYTKKKIATYKYLKNWEMSDFIQDVRSSMNKDPQFEEIVRTTAISYMKDGVKRQTFKSIVALDEMINNEKELINDANEKRNKVIVDDSDEEMEEEDINDKKRLNKKRRRAKK